MQFRVIECYYGDGKPYYLAQYKRFFFWNTYTKFCWEGDCELVRDFSTKDEAINFIKIQKLKEVRKKLDKETKIVYTDSTESPADKELSQELTSLNASRELWG